MQLFISVLLIGLYLGLFFLSGSILCHILKLNEGPVFTLVYGYFTYFCLFFIAAVIPKIIRASLTLLSFVWIAVMILIVVCFVYTIRHSQAERLPKISGRDRLKSIIILTAIAAMVVLLNTNADYITIWDAAYYIGDVNTSVYTDSISAYDPYTGALLKEISPDYFLEMLQDHSAVMCRISSLPALLEVRITLFSVNIIMFYLIVVLFSRFFFPGKNGEQILFLFLFMLFDLFTYNMHTRSQILLMRGYEGKAVAANIIVFGLLYILFKFMEYDADHEIWKVGFVVSLASFGLNMTSILLVPALTVAVLMPHILITRKW